MSVWLSAWYTYILKVTTQHYFNYYQASLNKPSITTANFTICTNSHIHSITLAQVEDVKGADPCSYMLHIDSYLIGTVKGALLWSTSGKSLFRFDALACKRCHKMHKVALPYIWTSFYAGVNTELKSPAS